MNAGHVLSVHGKPSPDGLGGPDYRSSLNLNTKVLDFVKSGGPDRRQNRL